MVTLFIVANLLLVSGIVFLMSWLRLTRTVDRQIHILQEGLDGGRTVLVIEGCNQRDGLANWLVYNYVFKSRDRILLIKRRYHESHDAPWWYAKSWIPLWLQFEEVLAAVQKAIKEGQIPSKFDVAGHSVGCIMAKRLTKALPQVVDKVIMHDPPTEERAELAKNWQFWKQAGFRALFHSIWTLIVFWRGFTPQTTVTLRCYLLPGTNEHDVLAFHRKMLEDSTPTFYGLLWYKGGELEQAQAKGWQGKALYIGTPNDLLFPIDLVNRDATVRSRFASFVSFADNTPHCFWLADKATNEQNASRVRNAVEAM